MPKISLSSVSLCLLIPLLVILMTNGFGISSFIASLSPQKEFFAGLFAIFCYALLAAFYVGSVLLTMYLVKVFQLASLESSIFSTLCSLLSGGALTYALVVMEERILISLFLLLFGICIHIDIHSSSKDRPFFQPAPRERVLQSQKQYVIGLLVLAAFGWFLSSITQRIIDYRGIYDDISYTSSMSQNDIAIMDKRFFALKYGNLDPKHYNNIDKEGLTGRVITKRNRYNTLQFFILNKKDTIIAKCEYDNNKIIARSFMPSKANHISTIRICAIRMEVLLDL